MERKVFLKNSLGFLGMVVAAPSLLRAAGSCQSDMEIENTAACSVTNSETAGPFPTISPASWVRTNIVGDRTGIPFTINITIKNTNGNCNALSGAIVDIWHCDKDGNYSEYGGTGMQPANYTSNHFLRGRQTTDANGLVSFTSIFPGWYTGRATHVHVHVYNASGTSLLITQIAFPEGTNSAVVQVNAATSYGYTKGMTGYTYNAGDNVFSDGVSNEMSVITGSIAEGFVQTHTIFVAGPTLGVADAVQKEFQLQQNFPNPFQTTTKIPLLLNSYSTVKVDIIDLSGRHIGTPINGEFPAGTNYLELNRNNLSSGYYIFRVIVENDNGVFSESKKMLVH